MESEFRDVVKRLNGLCASVESGFAEVKAELRYSEKNTGLMRTMCLLVVVLAGVAVLLSGYAVSMASSNRALILEMIRTVNQQARQIEQTSDQVDRITQEESLPVTR